MKTQVPTSPEDIAAAMDPWEAANGATDLYDELVTHLGQDKAWELWRQACIVYDATHSDGDHE
ncbi:hypothetical protein [Streptomyces sp. NPDC001404]|uniref:hypothetical protein n=1 Tax=Streptomyces sp. NPDC001404 TaxID=3364571 RepID=UPI00368680E8